MSSAGNSTIQILPTSGSSQFDPIVHIFNGTPDSTKGYNVINVLISAAYPVYVRVLQSIFNGGPWGDIEYFDYPNGSPSGQGMFITVPIRAEWFYVSVENRAMVDNNIRLQTIKQNSDLVGSVVGVTGGLNITNFPSFFGITGVAGITGFVTTAGRDETLKTNTIYVDSTGSQRTTIVPARKDNAKYIYEMDLDQIIEPLPVDGWSLDPRGRDGWYFNGNAQSSLTWFGNASQIFAPPVVPFNMLKSVYFVATMGNTMILPKISITTYYINTNTLAYTWEYNIDTVVNIYNGETYLFYCGNNALNLHTSYRHVPMNSNRVIGPGNEYVHDIKVIATANSQFLLERAGICDPSGNYETVFDTNKDIIVRDKLANLDFCGSYLNTLISGTDGVNIYPIYTDASGALLTKLSSTDLVGVTGDFNLTFPDDTYIGITGLVGVTGSMGITVPANTYIGITGMVGISGMYNGLIGVTGSSEITVPANTYIGITGMVGVSGYYNGLVGVTGSSEITVPANTFIGITGMVGVSGLVGITGTASITVPADTYIGITGIVGISGYYNGLVGVTGSSEITVPANTYIGITGMVGVSGLVVITGTASITVPADTYIGITGMVGVSGYYNGLVGVTGSSEITVPANTFIGITGMVGVSGLVGITGTASITVPADTYIGITGIVGISGAYNGLVGVTGSSAITVPANTFIGITGMVGVSGLVGITGSAEITVPANTFIGITGMVGVSGMYNGLVGVTGSSQITVPANTFIGITGMVGVSGYYNGLVGVTGSSVITVPANTFIGITGMVGVSGFYNGLVGVTGSSAITVPANTFIGITGMVGVSGLYNGLVGVTGASFPAYLGITGIVGVTDTEANTTLIEMNETLTKIDSDISAGVLVKGQDATGTRYPLYLNSKGIQRTEIYETAYEPIKRIFETDFQNTIMFNPLSWALDLRGRDGWYYTPPAGNSLTVVTIYNSNNGPPIQFKDMSSLWVIITFEDADANITINVNSANSNWSYKTTDNIYLGKKYMFYYGNNAIDIHPEIQAIPMTRTVLDSEGIVIDGPGNVTETINNISLFINKKTLLDSTGIWDSSLNMPYEYAYRGNIEYKATMALNTLDFSGTSLKTILTNNFLGVTGSIGSIMLGALTKVGQQQYGIPTLTTQYPYPVSNESKLAISTDSLTKGETIVSSPLNWDGLKKGMLNVTAEVTSTNVNGINGQNRVGLTTLVDNPSTYPVNTYDTCINTTGVFVKGKDENGNGNYIYTGSNGVQLTQIVSNYEPYTYILEKDKASVISISAKDTLLSDWITDPSGREGWYGNMKINTNTGSTSAFFLKFFVKDTVNIPVIASNVDVWMILSISNTLDISLNPPKIVINYLNNQLQFPIYTLSVPTNIQLHNNKPYLFYYGNTPPKLHSSYTPIPMVFQAINYVPGISQISSININIYCATVIYSVLVIGAGFFDKSTNQEYNVQFKSNNTRTTTDGKNLLTVDSSMGIINNKSNNNCINTNSAVYAYEPYGATCDTVTYTAVEGQVPFSGPVRSGTQLRRALDIYQIRPKRKYYVMAGITVLGNVPNPILGGAASARTLYDYDYLPAGFYYTFDMTQPPTTTTYNLIFDMINSEGDLIEGVTRPLTFTVDGNLLIYNLLSQNTNLAYNIFNHRVVIREGIDNLYPMNKRIELSIIKFSGPVNVGTYPTLRQTQSVIGGFYTPNALTEASVQTDLNGVFVVPNGYIAWVTHITIVSSKTCNFALACIYANGQRKMLNKFFCNEGTSVHISNGSGEYSGIGGVFTAKDTIFIIGLDKVVGYRWCSYDVILEAI